VNLFFAILIIRIKLDKEKNQCIRGKKKQEQRI